MTLKQKVILLAFADIMMAIPLITVDVLLMRITLIALILFKLYYFIFKIVLGRIDENLLAVDENFAFVGSVYSADDVHKRSFSATVLS